MVHYAGNFQEDDEGRMINLTNSHTNQKGKEKRLSVPEAEERDAIKIKGRQADMHQNLLNAEFASV